MIPLWDNWRSAPGVPGDWVPAPPPGAVQKDPVKNRTVLRILREVLPGEWHKVYCRGRDGTEIHYFQHKSGKVALVKLKYKRK